MEKACSSNLFSGPLGTRLWHLSYQWIIYIYIVKLNFETTFLWFHGLWSLLCLHTAIIRHITRLIRPLTWPPNYTFHTTKEKMPLDNSKKQTQRRLCVKWAASAAIWAPIKIPYRWVVAIDLLSLLGGAYRFPGFCGNQHIHDATWSQNPFILWIRQWGSKPCKVRVRHLILRESNLGWWFSALFLPNLHIKYPHCIPITIFRHIYRSVLWYIPLYSSAVEEFLVQPRCKVPFMAIIFGPWKTEAKTMPSR